MDGSSVTTEAGGAEAVGCAQRQRRHILSCQLWINIYIAWLVIYTIQLCKMYIKHKRIIRSFWYYLWSKCVLIFFPLSRTNYILVTLCWSVATACTYKTHESHTHTHYVRTDDKNNTHHITTINIWLKTSNVCPLNYISVHLQLVEVVWGNQKVCQISDEQDDSWIVMWSIVETRLCNIVAVLPNFAMT